MDKPDNIDVPFAIAIVTIAFLMLSVFVISFAIAYFRRKTKYQQEIAEQKHAFEQMFLRSRIEVQEETFSLIGKELHDNIGQLLSTTKMLIGITERSLQTPPDTLHTANETVGKAISELRALSKSLNKEWLEQFDVIENLLREIVRINSAGVLNIKLDHSGKLQMEREAQIVLFRILQEGIQNVLKHSRANDLNITISRQNELIIITLKDNGLGFDSHSIKDGVGMINMKQRARLLGGSIQWEAGSSGCLVTIRIPENLK